jgi:TRAP-type mannitol/chloroaromatic compound transport system permease large subunit
MSKIFQGVIPFILTDIVRIVLLVSFPVLSLWLLQ